MIRCKTEVVILGCALSLVLTTQLQMNQEAKRVRVSEPERIQLSEKSFMTFDRNAVECTRQEFDDFYKNERPETQEDITVFGKTTKCPRFQRLYGADVSYRFSSVSLKGADYFPEIVQRCMDYAKEKYPEYPWKAALVNFYEDGTNYIAAHSDDERDLIAGAPILSFSFGAKRTFRIREKGTKKVIKELPTENRSMISMNGDMQKEYTHEIPKINGDKGRSVGKRINITVRCMNNLIFKFSNFKISNFQIFKFPTHDLSLSRVQKLRS